ncbi:MAG: DUF2956 domain-containing protein [Pseudomonadales bacterium]|nr:DUF2956 domain-containing protein [Pseudomonadales bacterium]
MSKYKQDSSNETVDDAAKIAKGNQRPGQSKEQTKLIAQGIQKGIEQYKKNHKAKARDLDKKLKTLSRTQSELNSSRVEPPIISGTPSQNTRVKFLSILPWGLLILSWSTFAVITILGH